MENNANEAHIFWKSPDQQTEVWMKQVSGKTPEEKKEQSRSGYRLLAEMIKTRYAYDLEKETDSVMRTETGKPYLRLHPELFFNISHSGEWIACVLGNVPVGIDIQYHREIKLEQTARKICTPQEWKLFTQADTEKEKKNIYYVIDKRSDEYKNVEKYGKNVIDFMSVKHMLYIMSMAVCVSSDSKSHLYEYNITANWWK